MSATRKDSSVRVRGEIYAEVLECSEQTKYSAAQIVELCVEDCLAAVKTGKPILPRLAKIIAALKK